MTRLRRASQAACLGLLCLVLASCGGGGSTTTIIIEPGALGKQWRGTDLGDRSMAITPGGGYALVGEVPQLDWLAFQVAGAVVDLRQTSYANGGWQTGGTPRASGVHGVVFNGNATIARAGDWTVLVGRDQRDLWAQLRGPGGQKSAEWPLSSNADGPVHAVVDANGKARIYWAETNAGVTKVYAMHFDNALNGIPDGEVANMSLSLLSTVAGPDGKGWLLYPSAGNHFMRTVDAVNGLGAPVQLNELAQGAVQPLRRAVAETATRLSTVAVQGVGTGSPCVGVRRLDGGSLLATTCVNGTQTDVGTRLVALAVEPGGYAVAVWSGGSNDHTLYGAARQPNGTWSMPRVVATVPAGFHAATVTAKVHTDGSAIVAYRQADGAAPDPLVPENAVPYAVMWDTAAQAWGAAERFDAYNGASAQLAVAFNSRGEPGVLNFARIGSSGLYQVRFAARLKGKWTAVSLQDNASLATVVDDNADVVLASMQRLAPLGDGGWAAFWELTSNLVPGFGRRVVAAAYQ